MAELSPNFRKPNQGEGAAGLVRLSPGDLQRRWTPANRATLLTVQLAEHHAGGGAAGRPLDLDLILFGAAPGRDDETNRFAEVADQGLQGVHPNRVRLAKLLGPLEEIRLDALQHCRDGGAQVPDRHRGFRSVEAPDDHDRALRQVAGANLHPDGDALQLPLVELEARPLVTPVDLDPDVVELGEDTGQGRFDLASLSLGSKDGDDHDLHRGNPGRELKAEVV